MPEANYTLKLTLDQTAEVRIALNERKQRLEHEVLKFPDSPERRKLERHLAHCTDLLMRL